MKYLLTGGGTGGHVYPALAIANEIRRRHAEVEFLYVGLRDKLESWVVPDHGYPIRYVHARPFPRSSSLRALMRFGWSLVIGIMEGGLILVRYRPDVIIGTGGYGSAPILFAHAALAKIGMSRARVFVYEPNAYPGLLNQAVGRIAHRIGVAFEKAACWFDMKRVAVVGYPVRRELMEGSREQARAQLHVPRTRKVLLVFGGSSGSRVINQALVAALPKLRECADLLILHITGRHADAEYDAEADTASRLSALGIQGDTASWYRRYDYLHDIQHAYRAADLVVCRGGAGTLTEVGLCGLPAIIVPLPTAAEDHQAINARELWRAGAAQVLYERARWQDGRVVSCVDPEQLAAAVLALMSADDTRRKMAEAAAGMPVGNSLDLILGELDRLVGGHRPPPLDLEYPRRDAAVPSDPNGLLRYIQLRLKSVGGIQGLEAGELAYLRYQADRLLVSEAWYEIPLGRRNVGVKLIGCLQYAEQLALLLAMLKDRRPVPWLKRICGGDFVHGGLLRRNIIQQGLLSLRCGDSRVRDALLAALRCDPYFEVRSAAAGALGTLFGPDAEIERGVVQALADPSPAVVVQAIKAAGMIGTRRELLPRLRAFYLSDHWPYRMEVVEALIQLLRRGVLERRDLVGEPDRILATSSFFRPEFPLNERLRRLAELSAEPGHVE